MFMRLSTHALSVSLSQLVLVFGLVFLAIPSTGHAKDTEVDSVELFEGMEAGLVDAKFVALGTDRANVILKNKSDKPLHIRLPEAFAGVPILGQGFGGQGGGGGFGGQGGGQGGGGGGQALGGGGGQGGGGFGGGGQGGGGGGFLRVAPERQRKVAVQTVCLEHGKPDPQPKMEYKIVPLDTVTKNASVHLLCKGLGNKQLSQNVAQAVAWHLMDDMSWEELAAKNKVESKYTGNVSWFSQAELKQARFAVEQLRKQEQSVEETSSSSVVEFGSSEPKSYAGN